MREFARTLGGGLLLALLLRPPAAWRLRPAAHFWWLLLPGIAVSNLRDWVHVDGAVRFYAEGVQGDALGALLVLAVAMAVAGALRQRVQAWSIAVHASAASVWIGLGLIAARRLVLEWPDLDPQLADRGLLSLACGWWTLVLLRVFGYSLHATLLPARLAAALLAAGLTLGPFFVIEGARYWYPDYEAIAQAQQAADDQDAAPPRGVDGSAEQLLYAQPGLIDAALAGMRPGTPGSVDAFLLAFGGDANEDVFRNEVLYAERLFVQRFGMAGRTLVLLNHPDTTGVRPLATLSNLRLALAGIGARMQRDEDLLVLFATSHGSEDHELYVDLEPLPLDQIDPASLRDALDSAAIDWRVLLLSACYSGGFVEGLRSPQSLVITAARADRPSFGCGADSDITWFGRALLVHALNRTQSFVAAFELAKHRVARMEKAEDYEPSEPQIDIGVRVEAQLARWEGTLAPAAKLAWSTTAPTSACRGEPRCPNGESEAAAD